MSSTELGTYNGRAYREVNLRLKGTAPGGAYDVPATLAYPTRSRDHSGVALVDVVNTIVMAYPGPLPSPVDLFRIPTPEARFTIGDEYLFGPGHVYLSVEWDKDALANAGTGTIAQPTDAFSIIRDVAGLARDPSMIPGQVRPHASGTVVAYGLLADRLPAARASTSRTRTAPAVSPSTAPSMAARKVSAWTRPWVRSVFTRAVMAPSRTAAR